MLALVGKLIYEKNLKVVSRIKDRNQRPVGVQSASEAQECMAQALQVTLAIFIVQKARQPVVAPLHYVLRNAGDIVTDVGPCATASLVSHVHDDQ